MRHTDEHRRNLFLQLAMAQKHFVEAKRSGDIRRIDETRKALIEAKERLNPRRVDIPKD